LVLQLARAVGDVRPVPGKRPRVHGDHYHDGTCVCELADTLVRPLRDDVAFASIFSKTDGVVDWATSREEAPSINIEVKATHLGLTVNVEVYRAIAWLLAGSTRKGEHHVSPAAV
jgi:hypothetical protein